MHTLLVIAGGLVLLGVFLLFGRLSGGRARVIASAKVFIPVWLALAVVNMWVGVTRAGYTFAQELSILVVVIAVPAAVAALVVRQLARG